VTDLLERAPRHHSWEVTVPAQRVRSSARSRQKLSGNGALTAVTNRCVLWVAIRHRRSCASPRLQTHGVTHGAVRRPVNDASNTGAGSVHEQAPRWSAGIATLDAGLYACRPYRPARCLRTRKCTARGRRSPGPQGTPRRMSGRLRRTAWFGLPFGHAAVARVHAVNC